MPILTGFLSRKLAPYLDANRWLLAYSGGVDSHVLLDLLLGIPGRPPITAVHINHQLQPEAVQWRIHCEQQAKAAGIDFIAIDVDVDLKSGHSIEDAARRARYQAFESIVVSGDVLFFGHHLDDQIETLMLRMLRGSGTRGSAAMPASRPIGDGVLMRPLLDTPRSAIESYAETRQLVWVEDPSNQREDFDRNFLRHSVLPSIEQRWPAYRQTLSRTALLNDEAAYLNDELADSDLRQSGVFEQGVSSTMAVKLLEGLGRPRQKNLLRHFLTLNRMAVPSAAQLNEALDQLLGAGDDAAPLIEWHGVQLRRFDRQIMVMTPLPPVDTTKHYHWNLTNTISLGNAGQLSAVTSQRGGIDPVRIKAGECVVKFRQGGERCQPAGRGSSQTLKKLFQEYRLAPWLRDRIPLITCQGDIVAVGDLWVCEGWQVEDGSAGVSVLWQQENLIPSY